MQVFFSRRKHADFLAEFHTFISAWKTCGFWGGMRAHSVLKSAVWLAPKSPPWPAEQNPRRNWWQMLIYVTNTSQFCCRFFPLISRRKSKSAMKCIIADFAADYLWPPQLQILNPLIFFSLFRIHRKIHLGKSTTNLHQNQFFWCGFATADFHVTYFPVFVVTCTIKLYHPVVHAVE